MEEAHDIRNRTFSFGAHGYNQDDVDRYLRELADRVDSADVDWHRRGRAPRRGRRSASSRSATGGPTSTRTWPSFGRGWSSVRARRPMNGAAPEAAAEPAADSDAETDAMPSGWAQGIVERLRRVTEASTASTALAEVANAPVPDVVSVTPLRLEEEVAEETADPVADRVRLFRMATALGVEDAVSMSVEELVAAIDRVQDGRRGGRSRRCAGRERRGCERGPRQDEGDAGVVRADAGRSGLAGRGRGSPRARGSSAGGRGDGA